MKKLMSTTEAAQICGVHQTTIIRWIDAGRLDAQKTPGGHRRIVLGDLVRFMREHRMPIPMELERSAAPKRIRVLIVDDEATVTSTFDRALSKFPQLFEVEVTNSGVDAILKIGERPPDVLVLDLAMPGVDGYEVCEQVRRNPRSADIDVIAITGQELGDVRTRALKAGARIVLAKPISPTELQEVILARRLQSA